MTSTLIITLCSLLLLSYIFDITSANTRIPSVILLFALGFLVHEITRFFGIALPNLNPVLPLVGTIGLILIVLEGSLEIELTREKIPALIKLTLFAVLPLILFSLGLAYALQEIVGMTFKSALANAIPLGVISSAIAIPSAQNLNAEKKEFVIYESSLSDIFGVIFFDFITLNDEIRADTFGGFALDILLILLVTFIATIGLAFLLSKIRHHIKFAPIILMTLLIYVVAKVFHLPALIFILIFGLFMGNLDKIKNSRFIQFLRPEVLTGEVERFRELIGEMAFLIRSLFFIVFGFLINADELLNPETLIWSGSIVAGIFLLRLIMLWLFKLPVVPLVFIAPRGLITILLFISIPISMSSNVINNSLVIQVVILSALFMMIGMFTQSKKNAGKRSVKQVSART